MADRFLEVLWNSKLLANINSAAIGCSSLKALIQSNLVIRNGLIRHKLVLRNHFPWPIVNLLNKVKEHLVLRNNFNVTKKFYITKFDCSNFCVWSYKDWTTGSVMELASPLSKSFRTLTKNPVTNCTCSLTDPKGKENSDLPLVCWNYWPPPYRGSDGLYLTLFLPGKDALYHRDSIRI